MVHFTAIILFPSLDISLIATGHFGLCIIIKPSGEWYPVTSSPGIGLQHFAISYDCSLLSTFSLKRNGTFLSIFGAWISGSLFSFLDPISFNSQYLITFLEGFFLIIFFRWSRSMIPSSIFE